MIFWAATLIVLLGN